MGDRSEGHSLWDRLQRLRRTRRHATGKQLPKSLVRPRLAVEPGRREPDIDLPSENVFPRVAEDQPLAQLLQKAAFSWAVRLFRFEYGRRCRTTNFPRSARISQEMKLAGSMKTAMKTPPGRRTRKTSRQLRRRRGSEPVDLRLRPSRARGVRESGEPRSTRGLGGCLR